MTGRARSFPPAKCSDAEFAELTEHSTPEDRTWLRQMIDMYEALPQDWHDAFERERLDPTPIPDNAHDPELPLSAADRR